MIKRILFCIIICFSIQTIIPINSAVIPSFIPNNEGIPDHILSRLSLDSLSIIANKYNMQIFSDRIRIDSRPKCQESQDFDGNFVIKGCELGVYICDQEFHKKCLWIHKTHCQCSSPNDFFKFKECRISITKVPTGDSKYPYINMPIGECKLAIWIIALISIISAIFLGILIKLIVTSYYKS